MKCQEVQAASSEPREELLNGLPFAAFDVADEWDALTPRFVLEYKPNDGTLLYGSVTRGFKAGGFNSNQAQREPFAPESLWSYEIGAKLAFPGSIAHLLASGFVYDYTNIQVNVLPVDAPFGAFPEIENAARASVKGFEVEAFLRPAEGFEIDVALTILELESDERKLLKNLEEQNSNIVLDDLNLPELFHDTLRKLPLIIHERPYGEPAKKAIRGALTNTPDWWEHKI